MRERHPVTWHSLAQSGIVVRGPVIDDIGVWTDPTGLADSVRENVDTYWRGWHRVGSRSFSRRGLLLLTDGGPAWCVLGVSRLHYTLTTKRIASKGAAGVYAREVFSSRWHRIVDESLRLHRQEGGPSRYGARRARRRDVLDFLDHVIKDAGQLPRG
ncbi:uncharacterized protein DUF4111 [Actinokineospora auranticolor]|uniref:Uncharacterized protein DUF4111 n=2 Tax=Actinokineospora auranticolor TaxID=155976 RepID=A0A2S6GHN4_9PSEU|nr:uncharacterized protein DUF4111 [Actinokineospora auranticolor]